MYIDYILNVASKFVFNFKMNFEKFENEISNVTYGVDPWYKKIWFLTKER